ncbi:hypothetical protein G3I76_23195 [Streptomyces sp. SID11233]|nr:hypothetical protein [Streptomyces sp. SID11233]
MRTRRFALLAPTAALAALAVGAVAFAPDSASAGETRQRGTSGSADWQRKLKDVLPSLGHRNWIVVTDSAYPQQTSPGVTTMVTGGHQVDVVKGVIDLLGKQPHVKAHVQLDKELGYIPEDSAPGITRYRKDLDKALAGQDTKSLLHEDLIGRLDDAGREFNVIVLKTDLTLPYTSVFFELDAKYWDDDREADLRKRMEQAR